MKWNGIDRTELFAGIFLDPALEEPSGPVVFRGPVSRWFLFFLIRRILTRLGIGMEIEVLVFLDQKGFIVIPEKLLANFYPETFRQAGLQVGINGPRLTASFLSSTLERYREEEIITDRTFPILKYFERLGEVRLFYGTAVRSR
jgi:hypothetical protein